mmetsp:Transcript_104239/g.222843  ORF Transcript_104239/g.222843 Transcript_104239/m.222843 type:complete len:219 (+) Transcript_104239:842-1498(+)
MARVARVVSTFKLTSEAISSSRPQIASSAVSSCSSSSPSLPSLCASILASNSLICRSERPKLESRPSLGSPWTNSLNCRSERPKSESRASIFTSGMVVDKRWRLTRLSPGPGSAGDHCFSDTPTSESGQLRTSPPSCSSGSERTLPMRQRKGSFPHGSCAASDIGKPTRVTAPGLTKSPRCDGQRKYRTPWTSPSFLPASVSSSTPTHWPAANEVSPT